MKSHGVSGQGFRLGDLRGRQNEQALAASVLPAHGSICYPDGEEARRQVRLVTARHFPKPKDWQQFERSIWALARDEFDPNTEMNGREGQWQAGAVAGRRRRVGMTF
jgi:hypothetical protein